VRVDLFDFDLPEDLIALRPVEPRDSARLLVVDPKADCRFADQRVVDLPNLLRAGDCLVFNNTRVIPARLHGLRHREGASGARVEVLLHQRLDDSRWVAFARPAKRLRAGDRLQFGGDGGVCYADELSAEIEERGEGGEVTLQFSLTGAYLDAAIARHGEMPLPPYIAGKRATDERDRADYQTVYAEHDGAVAAPTAGLHYTPALLERLTAAGIDQAHVTLHVGAGTFLPVKATDTNGHQMHAEWGVISHDVANKLNAVKRKGGRIVAVGTTSLRLLESAAAADGALQAWTGSTDIFITPGYHFRFVDGLLTNFHLPRSTLFMLVSALCGLETMQAAYRHAIKQRYRFYSYGDTSLLWPSAS
jgi:S-adenosylmethionine:tRNA ribosyltransferase-isomerase